MAAAVHSRQPHSSSRLRSSSDPFVDPSALPSSKRPPPPPPKSPHKSSTRTHHSSTPKSSTQTRDQHRDITEAVRDTVTVRGSTDYNPRTKMGRSQTALTPSPNGSTRNAPPMGRRSQSQDSVLIAAAAVEKAKANAKGRPKKGSQHADVIDRLDFTGVGPMFHHDGPFDACAPSRNRQRNKAPMLAWSARQDEMPKEYNDNPYPTTANAYKPFSSKNYDPPKKKVDAIAEAWGIHEPEPYEEFFAGGGTGRPDGDTPASSIYNGKDSHNSHSTSRSGTKRAKDGRDPRDVYKEYLDEGQQQQPSSASRTRAAARRSIVPPPQPIFVPDPNVDSIDAPTGSPPLGSPGLGAPKRSKSLMQRIRKMRDAPNVPVGADYDDSGPPSPNSPTAENSYPGASSATTNATRPTHRSQNSFLGRFGGGSRTNQISPTSEKPEPYVYIEDQKKSATQTQNKDLPATPEITPSGNVPTVGYFEGGAPSGGAAASPGLGRKTSLMKKVRGVVRAGTKGT